MRNALVLSLVLGSLFFILPAQAQYYTGPIATAMGGAGRAAADPNESMHLNPASLGHLDNFYFFGTNYVGSKHPSEGDQEQFGVVFADGSGHQVLPGAFSYQRRKVKALSGAKATEEEYRLALGGSVYRRVMFGVGGHYRVYDRIGASDFYQSNLDLGTLFTPVENVGLALTAYNVLSAETYVPVGVRNVPTLAVGIHGIYKESFRARLDFVRPDKFNPRDRIDVQAGVETVFTSGFVARVGCNWKETEDKTLVGLGLGYKGPRLNFDYTYEKDIRTDQATRHLVDLWLPF